MIQPLTVGEQLLFMTVRISGKNADGLFAAATGFFFDIPLPGDERLPVVISNGHVVDEIEKGEFLLHRAAPDCPEHALDQSMTVTLSDFRKWWVRHPNPNIDLAAAPLLPMLREAGITREQVIFSSAYPALIFSDDQLDTLRAIEDVTMVGYPQGIWDDINNLPLVRRGITSTHPTTNFRGKPEGVVDMACFVGSSGSPIFVFNEGLVVHRDNVGSFASRLILLGVLCAAFTTTEEGSIEYRNVPTARKAVPVYSLFSHLGTYIKAKEILVLAELIRSAHLTHAEIQQSRTTDSAS
jgi:hypothetical protein